MQIGTFKRDGVGFSGQIRTLTISHDITLEPVRSASDKAPDFRAYSGVHEVGIAYRKTSERGNEYLSVLLDDPSFTKAVWCNLLLSDRDELPLMWDRPKPKSA